MCSLRMPLLLCSETTLFLGQLTSPRYTLPQNAVGSSRYRWNAYGNYDQYRPARFPPLLTGNFRIARLVAKLSTPRDEGANPGHRYFRPIGHPHVSLCRGRRSTGVRSVPLSSWNGFPSQRSDEAPVLADQGNMQEPRPLRRLSRRLIRRMARSEPDRRAITIVPQARTDTVGPG